MRRDRKKRLCHLLNAWDQEVFYVLGSQDHGGFLLADALHSVSDILNRSLIRQEKVQLIDRCRRESFSQELVTHVRQDIEKHHVLEFLVRIHQAFDAEAKELVIGDVGRPIEVFTLRADAHRVNSERNLAHNVSRIRKVLLWIVSIEFLFTDLIKVRKCRVVIRKKPCEIRTIRNTEP